MIASATSFTLNFISIFVKIMYNHHKHPSNKRVYSQKGKVKLSTSENGIFPHPATEYFNVMFYLSLNPLSRKRFQRIRFVLTQTMQPAESHSQIL